jgi:hypothetical protein
MSSNTQRGLVVSTLLLLSVVATAKESSNSWKFGSDLRVGYVKYNYQNAPRYIDGNGDIIPSNPTISRGHTDSHGLYVVPKISLFSPIYNHCMFKVTLAGATDFGINDEKYEKRNFVFDPNERKSFVLLQEAYVKYETKEHKVLIGREEIVTPMIDSDDWYMLANSFELAYYKNSFFKDTDIYGGYFAKMAGVWDSGANGTEFHAMSDASFVGQEDKKRAGAKGIYFGAIEYNDAQHHALKVWEYYAVDLYNTLFMQYDYRNSYKTMQYDFGLQFINFAGVGKLADHDTTPINYSLYSAKFDGSFDNGIDFATGMSKFGDGAGTGATLGAFGGYPYFANGMIFHFFEAGSLRNAASYKGQLAYNFKMFGSHKIRAAYRYTYYDLDPNYSFTLENRSQSKMILNGLQVVFGGEKGANFTATYEHVRVDNEPNTYSLRLIGRYSF